MHFTIFVYGSWGDIRPHVVLGVALKQAGHEVQVAASGTYEEWVRERGLDFYPLSVDVNTFAKDHAYLMDESFRKQIQTLKNVMKPMFTQMAKEAYEATRESDVVITVEFGMSLLFDVMRVNGLRPLLINPAPLNPSGEVPFAAMPKAPGWFPLRMRAAYNRATYYLIQRIQWAAMSGARNDLATGHLGLPRSKFRDFRQFLAQAPALTTVSPHVFERPTDWPEHFQVTGYLFDDDPDWTPPQDLLDFLDAGEAPVYIGFGSMPDSKPEATTRTIIEAVQRTGRRAIILTGWAGLGDGELPANIHILKYAPHHWLFPRMAALIHHGGAGTTGSGFRAGLPMTIVPHNADQPYWGRRVQELGVGTGPIPRKKLSVDRLEQAIRELTTNAELRQRAKILGEKIRAEDGLALTLEWTERLLGK